MENTMAVVEEEQVRQCTIYGRFRSGEICSTFCLEIIMRV